MWQLVYNQTGWDNYRNSFGSGIIVPAPTGYPAFALLIRDTRNNWISYFFYPDINLNRLNSRLRGSKEDEDGSS